MRFWRLNIPVVIFFILISIACSTSPEKAKNDPGKMNVTFSEDTFVQKAKEGDAKAVALFLQAGMDPNVTDKEGNTALIAAAKEGNQEVIELLLEKDADTEGKDKKSGGTPLIWAACNGHAECGALLLERGAKADARNDFGYSAHDWAARNGHDAFAGLLKKAGATPSTNLDKPTRPRRPNGPGP